MTHFPLPRYFVAHAASQKREENTTDSAAALHVIDSFYIGNRHLEEREWIVTVDRNGDLRASPREDRNLLYEALQNELTFNEISGGGRSSRLIEASEVFLFNLQLVEQVGDAPGWNDPVYLYGTLYETLPVNADQPSAGVKGQLTVTRGDLLDGLVCGAEYAFRYGGFGGAAGNFSKCFQMMLPGDTEAEIGRGAGIILAYPLFPAELLVTDVANEIIISQIIYDLLTNLKEDLKREQINHPLLSTVLPVPNRLELEQNLKSQGYTITGDTAVKKIDSSEGFKGLLATVFGALMSENLTLPPEGKAEDFLALARQIVRHLPKDFPTPRIIELRNCLKAAPANNRRQYQPPPTPNSINIPQNSAPLPPQPPQPVRAKTQKRVSSSRQPPAWMRDFISAHRQTNDLPPTLTSTLQMKPPIIRAAKPEVQEQKKADWRKDFEPDSKGKAKSDSPKKDSSAKPDWMKDFE